LETDLREQPIEVPIANVAIDINNYRIKSSTNQEYREQKMWENARLLLLANNKEFDFRGFTGPLGESLFKIALKANDYPENEIEISTGDQDLYEHIDFFISSYPIEVTSNLDFHTAKKNTGEEISLFLPKIAGQHSIINRSPENYHYIGKTIRNNIFEPSKFLEDIIKINREVLELYKLSQYTGERVFKRDSIFKKHFKVGDISEEKIEEIEEFLNMLEEKTLLVPSALQ
jgi:hypothetical protein